MGMPLTILPYDEPCDAERHNGIDSPPTSQPTAVAPSADGLAQRRDGRQTAAPGDQMETAASILARLPEEKLNQLSKERRKAAFVSMLRCVEVAWLQEHEVC